MDDFIYIRISDFEIKKHWFDWDCFFLTFNVGNAFGTNKEVDRDHLLKLNKWWNDVLAIYLMEEDRDLTEEEQMIHKFEPCLFRKKLIGMWERVGWNHYCTPRVPRWKANRLLSLGGFEPINDIAQVLLRRLGGSGSLGLLDRAEMLEIIEESGVNRIIREDGEELTAEEVSRQISEIVNDTRRDLFSTVEEEIYGELEENIGELRQHNGERREERREEIEVPHFTDVSTNTAGGTVNNDTTATIWGTLFDYRVWNGGDRTAED